MSPQRLDVRTEGEESTAYKQVIIGVFYDKDGKRHEYAYTAIGFAPENVIERANAREAEDRRRRAQAASPTPAPSGAKREALERHTESGKRGAQVCQLREFLRSHPKSDYTRQEIGRALGWGVNVVCARVDDLREEIKVARRRRCTVTRSESVEALMLKQPVAELIA